MKLVNLILENEVDKLAYGLGDDFKALAQGIEKEFDKADDPKEGAVTTASLLVALPAILGIVARIGRNLSKFVRQTLGDKPNNPSEAEQYFREMGELADKLHHLYIKPINFVVKKFVKDEHKAHNIANAIFHVVVAIMLIASGVTAVKALQAKNISLASLESALAAVKGGEVKEYIAKFFS
ncbi:MAG: hypothetical protein ACO22Y_00015 [Sediminibacterium sp.]